MDSMEVVRYQVRFYGGPSGAGEPSLEGVRAHVKLFGAAEGETAMIAFVEPPAEVRAERADGKMWMPMSAFDAVVDTLRNEAPVFLHWNPINGWMLQTDAEPVGEGETVR